MDRKRDDDDKEPAEGSRATVDEALQQGGDRRQGITNRPRADEEREQSELPPRGEQKQEG